MSNPEREVTDIAEILAILSKHEVCRIGFNDNLCPYVVPVNFGYEYQNGRWIFGTVAKLAMRQPFVLFKGLTFQKLCLP
ncbi:pyridoxamine 5'-phosphate oxidase family protein, partial [Salmonella enterica]|uniref:pyridoxamine 5'-phosphate oxidase family protein n=1 Tax=Salmonella enterica TaxID=28901 RepID=UPI00398C6741